VLGKLLDANGKQKHMGALYQPAALKRLLNKKTRTLHTHFDVVLSEAEGEGGACVLRCNKCQ
jgi:hypothetical protein